VVLALASITQIFEQGGLNNFNPITVRVFNENYIFHLALVGTLDELNVVFIKPSCGFFEVWHRKTDVPKTLWL